MSENSKKMQIATILTQLSLHFPRPDLEPPQFKRLVADMVADLEGFAVYQIERAAKAWRTSGERFFPNPGQLIAKIHEATEASIARARGQERYRQPAIDVERKFPKDLKPWRDVLREHGRPIPPDNSPMAMALDSIQEGKPRVSVNEWSKGAKASSVPLSEALRERFGQPHGERK